MLLRLVENEIKNWNAVRQGIISDDGCTRNFIKLRISAKDKNTSISQDMAIANAYGNKFIIPLDFEMLDSLIPYYQLELGNRLCYEITFNDYGRAQYQQKHIQMLVIGFHTYPWNTRLLLSQILHDVSQTNIKTWLFV